MFHFALFHLLVFAWRDVGCWMLDVKQRKWLLWPAEDSFCHILLTECCWAPGCFYSWILRKRNGTQVLSCVLAGGHPGWLPRQAGKAHGYSSPANPGPLLLSGSSVEKGLVGSSAVMLMDRRVTADKPSLKDNKSISSAWGSQTCLASTLLHRMGWRHYFGCLCWWWLS